MEILHFALCVDANYVKYAGVVMTSLVHAMPGRRLHLHLVATEVTTEDEVRLHRFASLYRGVELDVYREGERLSRLPEGTAAPGRLNRTVLLRVLLPDILPRSLRRVIYLDADMLCLQDLLPLWQVDLRGLPLGAVPYEAASGAENMQRIGLTTGSYFNAGLLVLDLSTWRKEKLAARVLDCYREHAESFKLLEQDALNTVLADRWQALPERFNYQLEANNPEAQWPEDAAVLHFVNEGKPWTKGCTAKVRAPYWQMVGLSLWNDMKETEPTTVKAGYLAGLAAAQRGDWQEAANYYGMTAKRLLEYYMAHDFES